VTVTPIGNGRFEVVSDRGRTLAYAVRRGSETWVFVDGQTSVIDANGPASHRMRRYDEAALSAPMPATVVSISAALGQAVKAGDVLVVLEAMKMELAVTAPQDGTVKGISCRVGELVQPGIPLVEVE
jgi:3-methylcrotonyl-CoA carboxylase alpha subunit